jgi:hypothetical protein
MIDWTPVDWFAQRDDVAQIQKRNLTAMKTPNLMLR